MDKSEFKNKYESIIISAVIIVVGILFCALPESVIDGFETFVLFVALLYGTICMIVYCLMPAEVRSVGLVLKSLIAIVLGVLLLFIRSFFILSLGIILIVSGVKIISVARLYKIMHDKKWWIELVWGVFVIALGATISVLCNTSVAKKLVLVLLGVSLILQGLFNFAEMFLIRKETKELIEEKTETQDFKDFDVK